MGLKKNLLYEQKVSVPGRKMSAFSIGILHPGWWSHSSLCPPPSSAMRMSASSCLSPPAASLACPPQYSGTARQLGGGQGGEHPQLRAGHAQALVTVTLGNF